MKGSALKLVEDLKPSFDLILPEEPDEDAVRRLRFLIGLEEEDA